MSAPLDPRERALDDAARALPRDVSPPPELLARVQGAIAERRVRSLPSTDSAISATDRPTRGWFVPRQAAAAAALLLVGAFAGAGAVLLRTRTTPEVRAVAASPTRASLTLTQFSSYERAAADLAALLAERRATLRPATIAVIERSLRQIDDALADVRAALERDPGSATLTDLARRLYDQKLDLLKRSTAPSIS
jgi:hypothetical protein